MCIQLFLKKNLFLLDEDSDTNEEAPLLGSNRDRLSSNNNNTSNHYGSALNNSSRFFN